MAYTKIKAIKKTLNKAIKYIENPAKTEGQQLVYGYNVEPLCAATEFRMTAEIAKATKGDRAQVGGGNNIAYHLIQSFAPEDKVSPEQALEIGKKLAQEFTGGDYEYVVSTHIDKGQIHNHIIINATSFVTYNKLRTQPYKTASKIRAISDRLCAENQLSTIKANERSMSSSYYEYQQRKTDTSWKSNIRKRMSWLLQSETNMNSLIDKAAVLGIQIDGSGKHLKYRMDGQERWVRGNKLDDMDTYTREGLLAALGVNRKLISDVIQKINSAVSTADSYERYITNLANSDITVRRGKDGILLYVLSDEEVVKESALGREYSTSNIVAAIYSQDKIIKDLNSNDSVDIAAQYAAATVEVKSTPDTQVIVDKRSVKEITTEGVLLRLPTGEDLFVDNNHINYVPTGNKDLQMELYFGTNYNYYVRAENGIQRECKGEDIVRMMSREYDETPHKLYIAENNIISLSDKGITIKAQGIERLFIEKDYLTYSHDNGGQVEVELYDTYSYSYKANKKDNRRSVIDGKRLRELLFDAARDMSSTGAGSLDRKISYAERKQAIAEVKGLSAALLLLRRENILIKERYDIAMDGLQRSISETDNKCTQLGKKISDYKVVLKYLTTYKDYLSMHEQSELLEGRARRNYIAAHQSELLAFDKAKEMLEQMKVDAAVDAAALMEFIKTSEAEYLELDKQRSAIVDRQASFKNAYDKIDSVGRDERAEEHAFEQKKRAHDEQIDNDGV